MGAKTLNRGGLKRSISRNASFVRVVRSTKDTIKRRPAMVVAIYIFGNMATFLG